MIEPHPLYLALADTIVARAGVYREFFRHQLDAGLVDQIRSVTNGNYVVGSSRFTAEVERALGRRATRGQVGRPKQAADID